MCLSISATVALGCLFAPKIYIVLFQPHKNVRQSVGIAAALNPQRSSGRPLFSRQGVPPSTSCHFGALNGNVTSPSNVDCTTFNDFETYHTSVVDELPYMDMSESEEENEQSL